MVQKTFAAKQRAKQAELQAVKRIKKRTAGRIARRTVRRTDGHRWAAALCSPVTVFKREWISILAGMGMGITVLLICCSGVKPPNAEEAEASPVQAQTRVLPMAVQTASPTSEPMQEPIPAWSTHISSTFGERDNPTADGEEFHTGLDLAMPTGTEIRAAQDGVVTCAEISDTGYGNHVILQHDGSLSTLYGHCSELLVQEGQQVKRGDVIALVGSTGNSTGPHVHFEVMENGVEVDPVPYLMQN